MSISIRSFLGGGGRILWFVRKHYSNCVSRFSFPVVARLRAPKINAYIDNFLQMEETPCFKFLMLETINRCNGKCAFCPANIRDEKRTFKKMSNEVFSKIIDELVEMKWVGTIFLQVNNEPLLDKRILDFSKEIRNKKPECKICVITNGTMLTIEKLQEMAGLVDKLVINDYSDRYRLSDNLDGIYRYVKKHSQEFQDIEIEINRRFSGEILATRAGNAPNKPQKNNHLVSPCIYPFTDLIVFPDGKVGICCNDCLETTDFGDVRHEKLVDIWNGDKFVELREAMRKGRDQYPFCVECDVVDAGSREKAIASRNEKI